MNDDDKLSKQQLSIFKSMRDIEVQKTFNSENDKPQE